MAATGRLHYTKGPSVLRSLSLRLRCSRSGADLAPSPGRETADLSPACWFMVSRRALAPVSACGEATKPGLAPASAHRLTKSAVSEGRPQAGEGKLTRAIAASDSPSSHFTRLSQWKRGGHCLNFLNPFF